MLIENTELLKRRIQEVDEDIKEIEKEVEELKELEEYYQRIVDAIIVAKHNPRIVFDIENHKTITSKPKPISAKLLETEQELKEEIKEIDSAINHYEEKIRGLKHTKLNISHKLRKQTEKKTTQERTK